MHWNGQPLIRRLMARHQVDDPRHEPDAFFHTECWKDYQRWKTNATRRLHYAVKHGVANPKPAPVVFPGGGITQPAALPADNPPPSAAVLPGVGNPQKRKADDLTAD